MDRSIESSLVELQALPRDLLRQHIVAAALDQAQPGHEIQLDGVRGGAIALSAATIAQRFSSTVLVVLPQSSQIDDVVDDLTLFTAETTVRYPAIESRRDQELRDNNYGERLRTLKQLHAADAPRIIVTSIQALLQPAPQPDQIRESSRTLRVGQRLDATTLARWLTENKYHSTSAVELPGEFSLRGGILDIFAADWEHPVRVELFDDEVESLRFFDLTTQLSIQALDAVELTVLSTTDASNGCFTTHLPTDATVILIEAPEVQHQAQQMIERAEHPEEYVAWTSLYASFRHFRQFQMAALAGGDDDQLFRMPYETVERFSGEIGKVRQELDQAATDEPVYLIAETAAEIKRLGEILCDTSVATQGRLHYVSGRLSGGFRLIDPGFLIISGNELFHRAPLRRTTHRRAPSRAIESFLELRTGDLVVHLSHGIARYRGLKLLEKDGHVEEHLELEFHGGTKIFVPSAKIELVQKYIGSRKTTPRLATIGGKNWARQKKAAESAVEDLAAELLQVQAEREASPGIRFGHDTDWQREFDAAFPYTETIDQLAAIESIKYDMEAAKPMDRLICGDVGFGKTELAMRAAFKAVDNGYQVAVLVPTTILAEQHFHTFVDRMAEFPFSIGKLSRFCTAEEQRGTIKALREGSIDIVIGTHRLASKDVEFANLGLLVIDEEQRFGVEVKERLKKVRSSIDVITLSATPIPRTLHMSLTGIRDISNLETPPEDRVAVETRVTRWSNTLIRNAIVRELDRGGQVYFVHNRVKDIEAVAKKLQFIAPEATIAIGHGQMNEGELEKVMVDFVNGHFDILLATTIVESGLDIPNANTIFLDDAHRYGLADLHQLRGRVGRGKHRGYCYLLVDTDKLVTPNAARRLRAIEEFSAMGAGFSIAMRDLEIRGAGNVLGTQQSGHIAMVGYELYCQLLEASVRRLKHLPPKINADVDIELPGEAYIPRDYVPDMRLKIDLYRRLARSVGDEPIAEMRQEFLDRFGPLPECVERMLRLAQLKTEAAFWQLDQIHLEAPYLVLRYTDRGRANQLVRGKPGELRIVDEQSIYTTLTPDVLADADAIIETALSVLS